MVSSVLLHPIRVLNFWHQWTEKKLVFPLIMCSRSIESKNLMISFIFCHSSFVIKIEMRNLYIVWCHHVCLLFNCTVGILPSTPESIAEWFFFFFIFMSSHMLDILVLLASFIHMKLVCFSRWYGRCSCSLPFRCHRFHWNSIIQIELINVISYCGHFWNKNFARLA